MIFHIIYAQSLITIFAFMVFILFVWTMLGINIKKNKRLWRAINGVVALLSVIVILYSTIIHRTADGNHGMPFIRTIEHIRQQPELIREMVMNAFLFFPFGLTLPYAIDKKRKKTVIITILSAVLLTCAIEFLQYLFDFGNAELSDIVMNLLGAIIGSVSYIVSRKMYRKKK